MTISRAQAVVITRIVGDRCFTRAFVLHPFSKVPPPLFINNLPVFEADANTVQSIHEAIAEAARSFVDGLHFFTPYGGYSSTDNQ
jgi:hypothetical protein